MKSLLKKEISAFFSSITGYIAIGVFLLVTGLILWVFPGSFNIADSGFAYLEPLFTVAPWIFLFLVPAVTMRLFAEEKKSGTLEVLYSQPISDIKIVIAKYLSALILIILSLLPTLIYYICVNNLVLESAPDNTAAELAGVDTGQTLGSYIGLFFLAAVYCAVGVFASSLTDNQIVAFLLAAGGCLFMYLGFGAISGFSSTFGLVLDNLGIDAHYKSISRGIIDTRDIIYFVSATVIFLMFAEFKLKSRNWK